MLPWGVWRVMEESEPAVAFVRSASTAPRIEAAVLVLPSETILLSRRSSTVASTSAPPRTMRPNLPIDDNIPDVLEYEPTLMPRVPSPSKAPLRSDSDLLVRGL